MPRQYTRTPPAERFWSKVQKSDGCWLWIASTQNSGYGQFGMNDTMRLAHRVSYELTYGPIPDGLFVCHSCDCKLCVRPDHLFLGTATDNMQDAVQKGRMPTGERNAARLYPDRNPARIYPERLARGDRNGSRKYPERLKRGEENSNAKLSDKVVHEIRRRYAQGETTQAQLAHEFHVCRQAVWAIVHGKGWKHLL